MRDNPFKIKQNSVRDRSVSGFNIIRNSGDNLLFMPFFSGWLGKTLQKKHLAIFYVLLFVLFSALIFRLGYLQMVRGGFYYSIAEHNRLKEVRIVAPRGIISDRFGKPLVRNIPHFGLYVQPQLISSVEQAD